MATRVAPELPSVQAARSSPAQEAPIEQLALNGLRLIHVLVMLHGRARPYAHAREAMVDHLELLRESQARATRDCNLVVEVHGQLAGLLQRCQSKSGLDVGALVAHESAPVGRVVVHPGADDFHGDAAVAAHFFDDLAPGVTSASCQLCCPINLKLVPLGPSVKCVGLGRHDPAVVLRLLVKASQPRVAVVLANEDREALSLAGRVRCVCVVVERAVRPCLLQRQRALGGARQGLRAENATMRDKAADGLDVVRAACRRGRRQLPVS
mmetsp:Transcript_20800/g.56797  ORF Transcript_20800/g.56797 Transcript_20800/m.56797 type:complete len:267 (+) Transcript_20800:221-1021(+)